MIDEILFPVGVSILAGDFSLAETATVNPESELLLFYIGSSDLSDIIFAFLLVMTVFGDSSGRTAP